MPTPVRVGMFVCRHECPRTDANDPPRLSRSCVCNSVFDVSGRIVKEYPTLGYRAGEHRMSWDGRDSSGRRVPAGVYFIRLEVGGAARTQKVTYLAGG